MIFTVFRDLLFGTENGVPGAGFEPAKLYAEDLESTPFDRSGTPACTQRSDLLFLTIALQQGHQDLWGVGVEGFGQAWLCRLVGE